MTANLQAHSITHCSNQIEYVNKAISLLKQARISQSPAVPTHFALTGGSSPLPIYQALSNQTMDWSHVHFWLSDERYVPLDHPASNFLQAKQTFLSNLNLQPESLHPYPVQLPHPQAAVQYSCDIDQFVHRHRFDLIMLGVGPDGHTASLFPDRPELDLLSNELVIPVTHSPKPPPNRLTFTFRLINQAKNILVLVKGRDRIDLVQNWLNGQPSSLPFTRIQPTIGHCHWLLLD